MRRILLASYPSAILGIMLVSFLHNVLKSGATLNIYPDCEWYLGSVFSFASESIRNLDWPLRMDTILGGVPLYNSPQVSTYYPFYFLYLGAFRTPLESVFALHNITLLHVVIFQINAYLLLRTLRLSREAAFVGVVFIVFNLSTLEIMKWTHLISSYSWTPLYLAGLVRVLERPRERSGIFMLVVSFVMMSFAMVGQPLIFAALFTVVIVSSYALRLNFWANKAKSFETAFFVLAAISIAICLSALAILPVVSGLSEMIRWISSDQAIVGNAPIPFDKFLTDQLSIAEIPSLIFSLGNRHDIADPYIGLFPILFAFAAIRQKARHWIVAPLALIAVYSFASSYGSNLGLAYVNYHIPILNKIREPSYFLLPLNLSIGVLAGFGVDYLIKDAGGFAKSSTSSLSWLAWLAALFLLISVIALAQIWSIHANIAIPFALFIYGLVSYRSFDSDLKRASTIVIVALSIAVQYIFVQWTSPTVANSDYLRQDLVLLETALSRVTELDPNHEYRVVFGRDINSQTASMLASYQGIRTLNSYINPLPAAQFGEMYYHGRRDDKYFNGLGAKFLVCKQCLPADVVGYEFREKIAGYSIYVTTESLPRTYISNNVLGEYVDLNDYITKISSNSLATFPVLFDSANPSLNPAGQGALHCVEKKELHSLNRLRTIVSCDLPAVYVLNEYFTKSWTVFINGREVVPSKVNGNQIGLPIGAGATLIEFRYAPRIVGISWAIFFVGCIGLLAILLVAPRIHLRTKNVGA